MPKPNRCHPETAGAAIRDVQAIVKYLGEERAVPIGSRTSAPWGYYIVVDEAELTANFQQLKRRALSTRRHARAFLRPSIVGPIVGQQEIEEKS